MCCGIYRCGRDCSNGGISGKFNNVPVIIEDDFGMEVDYENPSLVVLEKNAFGNVVAMPYANPPKGNTDYMFGGTYIASSDSRFSRAVEGLLGRKFYGAVPLHDRTETWEVYKVLSR